MMNTNVAIVTRPEKAKISASYSVNKTGTKKAKRDNKELKKSYLKNI